MQAKLTKTAPDNMPRQNNNVSTAKRPKIQLRIVPKDSEYLNGFHTNFMKLIKT